jgi:hypothetical protein
MNKTELKEKLNKLGCFFDDIYWEIDSEDNAMIMLDNHEGKALDNIWDICYRSGFREDYFGNLVKLKEDKDEIN